MHKAINNQLRPYGTHPYYLNARDGQVLESRQSHAVRAIVNNFKRGIICLRVAVQQLRDQDRFETEIEGLLS